MTGQSEPEPYDAHLTSALESVLLVATEPVTVTALAAALQQPRARVLGALHVLGDVLTGGIRLQVDRGRAQLVTSPENAEVVQRFLGISRPPALSRSAMEVLAVVAYRQPVTRPEIEAVRGVSSDRTVQTLLARGLIEELGRRDTVGHPIEYGTTFGFLEYFGLSSLDVLPPLEGDEPQYVDPSSLGIRPARIQE